MASSTTPIISPKPISIHIPPSLRHLAVSLPQFLSANPQYTSLVVGACIFAPQHDTTLFPSGSSRSAPKLLLVQRAATERAFPNLWEIPGGSSEPTDPTLLHSLAREVFEETGLHLTRVVRQIGKGLEFGSRPSKAIVGGGGGDVGAKPSKLYLKLTFEIEVAEFDEPGGKDQPTSSRHYGGKSKADDTPKESPRSTATPTDSTAFASLPPPSFNIILDPEEHQQYAWVTEESFNEQGPQGTYPTTSEAQRETILQALALKKLDLTSSSVQQPGVLEG